jgi:cellulose biosynthesis protein BcsQ
MSTVDFDNAVERLILACEETPGFDHVRRALLVRDLAGRLRLALDVTNPPAGLEDRLVQALGGWYSGPLLTTADPQPGRRGLALALLQQPPDSWPLGWPTDVLLDPLAGTRAVLPGERWSARQAVYSKAPWLTGHAVDPPWPLVDQAPRVTAFYSFKGGVGRSTTLAVLAVLLARRGQRVAVVDLDLEAPGLTTLLTPPDAERPTSSVVDYMLHHATAGRPPVLPLVPVGLGGVTISLVPAGKLDPAYLERLARLDTVGRLPGSGGNPVHTALHGLLKQLRGDHDHILLDCRTGLNDLGGVVLADLAHVDVLVGRSARADLEGLALVLRALARRRTPAARRLLTVQTFLFDPVHTPAGRATHEAHRDAQYDLFSEHWYDQEDLPDLLDDQQPHYPLPVLFERTLAQLPWLGDAHAGLWEEPGYHAVLSRLDGLWASEPPR